MTIGNSGVSAKTLVVKSFIRRFRTEILAEWKLEARAIPAAQQLPAIMLVDHLPELIDQIADIADAIATDDTLESSFETAQRHAIDRLEAGFDIAAIVAELSLLRGCILTVWTRENAGGNAVELRALNLAIDRAIEVSVARYADAHERTLAGIDRISTASLESRDLDDLLGRLLRVFVETTPAVDTAAILLREGDRLRLRACVGLDEALGSTLAIGEGFAGEIAAERKPRSLRAAYLDPLVQSDVIRDKGLHALYGVPLVQDGELLGVAHMGSLKADEFSQEDRLFFGSMLARATIGINHHMLRQELADSEQRYKRTASERERTLAKLESLLAASPVGIAFVDRELRYLRINDALAAMNGRPVADHIGRPVAEILPPDIGAKLVTILQRVLDTGDPVTLPFTRPDQTSLLATYFPTRSPAGEVTGLGGLVFDVTEQKRAHEALQVEQARLQSIIEHAPAAIWVKDSEGRIVLANHRLAEYLGHTFEEIIRHRSEDILPPEIAAQHRAHDEIVMAEHRAIEVEELVPTPDGPRTFLSIKFPIPSDPPLVGGIATEITERKQMEDDLRAAVKTREEILAVVSHDLRNPLGTVQLGLSLLQAQTSTDPRSRRHLEMIHRATQRMETLIDDLLDTESIRAGRLTLDTRREAVESVVGETLDLQEPIAAEKGIELHRKSDVRGIDVCCDRGRILQVFGNLVGNALKFCRVGDTITVTAERTGDDIRFSVADTGPGIAADVLPYLFDAYWSGPEHAKRGSGLGLYICRGIVEGHGGRIWVESTPGRGAKFCFTLPIAT